MFWRQIVHFRFLSSKSFNRFTIKQMEPLSQDIEDLHWRACDAEKETYIDPSTGLTVFTAYAHFKRGTCCGSRCRHCPFEWKSVREKTPKKRGPSQVKRRKGGYSPSPASPSRT